MSRVIGVVSVKGGVGKTTTAVNLATTLANDFNKKVLLVDANYYAPNLNFHLGILDPINTLNDVFQKKIKIFDAVYKHNLNFHFIASSLISRKIDPMKLRNQIKTIRSFYEIVILDSSPSLNDEMLSVMLSSDELLVVTTPDYATLSTTLKAVRVAKQKNIHINGLILNKVRNNKCELSLDEIEKATGVHVLGMLPDEAKTIEAQHSLTPISQYLPNSQMSIEYKKLAATLINEEFEDKRFFSNLKSAFSKRIDKHDINRQLFKDRRFKKQ
jgi:MinD-like ATPase involved in chromosome partitioning or flagellar assembly